jgi:beta-mannosidase
LIAWTGEELAAMTVKDLDVGPEAVSVGLLRAPTPAGAFVVDVQLVAGEVSAGRRYVLTGADDLGELLDGDAAVEAAVHGDDLIVRHLGGPVAPFVRVRDGRPLEGDAAGWLRVSDSGFVLLPGEERVVRLTWPQAGSRVVAVDGLGLHTTERLIRCR